MSVASTTLRAALMALGVLTLPSEAPVATGTPSSAPRPLYLAGGAQGLASGYGLPVVALPEPPGGLAIADEATTPAPAAEERCPLSVRAVVVAERSVDSFAMLSSGDDSLLVHVGDKVRTPRGKARVAAIEANAVVLSVGDAQIRCEFR